MLIGGGGRTEKVYFSSPTARGQGGSSFRIWCQGRKGCVGLSDEEGKGFESAASIQPLRKYVTCHYCFQFFDDFCTVVPNDTLLEECVVKKCAQS